MKKLHTLIPFSILLLMIVLFIGLYGGYYAITGIPYMLIYHIIPEMTLLEYFQLFVMIFLLYIYFSTWKFYGNIDFSSKKTRVNLIASILVVLCIWFYWFSYTPLLNLTIGHSAESLGLELKELRGCMTYSTRCEEDYQSWVNAKIVITLILTTHIWTYWILKPLYHLTKNLNKVNQKQICPFCSEKIKLSAIVCKHCGRDIKQSI